MASVITLPSFCCSGKNGVKFGIVMHLTYMVNEWHLKKLGKVLGVVLRVQGSLNVSVNIFNDTWLYSQPIRK